MIYASLVLCSKTFMVIHIFFNLKNKKVSWFRDENYILDIVKAYTNLQFEAYLKDIGHVDKKKL